MHQKLIVTKNSYLKELSLKTQIFKLKMKQLKTQAIRLFWIIKEC